MKLHSNEAGIREYKCVASGNPAPSYEWVTSDVSATRDGGTLVLGDDVRDGDVIYDCVATNYLEGEVYGRQSSKVTREFLNKLVFGLLYDVTIC